MAAYHCKQDETHAELHAGGANLPCTQCKAHANSMPIAGGCLIVTLVSTAIGALLYGRKKT
jgi:hypothetical protein